MSMLFKVELVDAAIFVEAKDWETALKKAREVAPKIFNKPSISSIRVAGTYSKYRGVWL